MTHALAKVEESRAVAAPRPAVGLIRPIAAPATVLQAQEETRAMIAEILQKDRDFGVIPGTDKPTMLKPGAERAALAFGCYYGEAEIVEREVDHDRIVEWTKRKKEWSTVNGRRSFEWREENGTSRGVYRYVIRVPVIHRETGQVVGSGIGSCSTMESKYVDRPRDSENTALKMAHKRALISACLLTFGLSDQFTQDVEDLPKEALVGENAPDLPAMDPPCPTCSGKMYDNRLTKKSPKQPDFKCKNRSCDGVIWPPRDGERAAENDARPSSAGADSSARSTPASTPKTKTSPSGATSSPTDDAEYTVEDDIDDDGVSMSPLDRAMDSCVPGGSGSFNGAGGKPLAQLSAKHIKGIRKWLIKKLLEDGFEMDEEGGFPANANPVYVAAVTNMKLVIEHKEAEEATASGQVTLGLDATPGAGSGGTVEMPKPGKVSDALGGEAAARPTAATSSTAASGNSKSASADASATSTAQTTNSAGGTDKTDDPAAIRAANQRIAQLLQHKDLPADARDDARRKLNAGDPLPLEKLQQFVRDLEFAIEHGF